MSYSGSGSGGGSIHSGSDVALNSPASGNVLQYDASLQKWRNGSISASQITDFASAVQAVIASTATSSGGSGSSGAGAAPATPAGLNLYKAPQTIDASVSTYPELATIANQPQAKWLTGTETPAVISGLVTSAAGKRLLLVIYAIPGRDSGGYSSGGFGSRTDYLNYITMIKNGLGNAPAIIILEPDALGLANGMGASAKVERVETLRQAVDILSLVTTAEVYIDASMWVGLSDQVSLLKAVDVGTIAGFAINTSAYNAQADCYTYGDSILGGLAAQGVNGRKYVIDSSRNGNGPLTSAFGSDATPWINANVTWCNPPGRAIGVLPGTVTPDHPNCRANLWIKNTGESDGTFPTTAQSPYYGENAPAAGVFWPAYARNILGYRNH